MVADFGRGTNLAAKLLADNGYQQVNAAFNGMNEWMSTAAKDLPQRARLWEQPNRFTYVTAVEMDELVQQIQIPMF